MQPGSVKRNGPHSRLQSWVTRILRRQSCNWALEVERTSRRAVCRVGSHVFYADRRATGLCKAEWTPQPFAELGHTYSTQTVVQPGSRSGTDLQTCSLHSCWVTRFPGSHATWALRNRTGPPRQPANLGHTYYFPCTMRQLGFTSGIDLEGACTVGSNVFPRRHGSREHELLQEESKP